jgi:hypothetical protein
MVDFKKMLLELCKNCVRVMQKTLLGLTHLTFKIINYYYYYYDNDNIFNNKSRHSEMRILLVYMLIVHRHRHALRAFSAMLCILPNKKNIIFFTLPTIFSIKKKPTNFLFHSLYSLNINFQFFFFFYCFLKLPREKKEKQLKKKYIRYCACLKQLIKKKNKISVLDKKKTSY